MFIFPSHSQQNPPSPPPALPPSSPSLHPPAPSHAIEDNDDTNDGDVSLHDDDEDDDDIGK